MWSLRLRSRDNYCLIWNRPSNLPSLHHSSRRHNVVFFHSNPNRSLPSQTSSSSRSDFRRLPFFCSGLTCLNSPQCRQKRDGSYCFMSSSWRRVHPHHPSKFLHATSHGRQLTVTLSPEELGCPFQPGAQQSGLEK